MPEPTAEASSSKPPKAQKQKAPKPAADGAAATAAAGGKSAKDLKKEKRAAAVAARGGGVNPKDIPPESGASGPSAIDMPSTPGAGTSRPSGPQRTGTGAGGMPIAAASGDGLARRPVMMTAETTYARPITMEEQFFGHLPKSVPAHSEDAVKGAKVHPLVIRLGVMMASGELRGANARTHALMIAFREVIRDYVSPDNADLWKDLPQHLSPNIAYLEGCRPKGIGGGNAIRWLKQEITRLGENEDDDMSEAEQKEFLMNAITTWITERMTAADDLIAENAKDKIQPGDTVVTFARSSLVEKTLLTAWQDMRERNYQDSFSVIVVDSQPLLEGRTLLSTLTSHSIPCTYTPLSSLPSILPSASLVLLGGSAVFANGALLSRAGTAQIAMLAKEFRVPVVACVETYKFADVTRLDGLGSNEVLRKADANIRKGWEATGAQGDRRIGNGRESTWGREWAEEEGGKGEGKVEKEEAHLAKGGKKKGSLSSLALLYDLTPADYITAVCTEIGLIPPRSGPTVTGKSSGVV